MVVTYQDFWLIEINFETGESNTVILIHVCRYHFMHAALVQKSYNLRYLFFIFVYISQYLLQ